MKPAVVGFPGMFRIVPVSGRNILSTNQDLTIRPQLYLVPSDCFANRSSALSEWVIDAYQRSSLGHTVSLNDGEAEALPKLLGFGIQCGSA